MAEIEAFNGFAEVEGYNGYEEFDDRFGLGKVGDLSKVHIDQIVDAEMHKKTHAISPRIILSTETPGYSESLGERAITLGPVAKMIAEGNTRPEGITVLEGSNPLGEKTILSAPIANPMPRIVAEGNVRPEGVIAAQEAENDDKNRNYALEAVMNYPQQAWKAIEDGVAKAEPGETEPQRTTYPNLAWESLKAGLVKERMTKETLHGHIKQAQDHQKNIDLLLDLTAELTGLPSDKDATLSQKAKDAIKELKERGVKIWEGDKIPKDKLAEVKSLTSSMVDKNRTELQTLFTTKIQVIIQNDASIMEALKNIVKENAAFIRAIIEKFTR